MEIINQNLLEFIEKSPSMFHCVNSLEDMLVENGFTKLYENEKWNLENGKKYFVTRNQNLVSLGLNMCGNTTWHMCGNTMCYYSVFLANNIS